MKKILVLGAGQSSPYLISYLLDNAKEYNWFVTVGDLNSELAKKRINNHSRGSAIKFDINDENLRSTHIKKADLVINMLSHNFQYLVAIDCVHYGTHMISASYQDNRTKELENDANRKDVLILCEMGLDPGIDHMSTMALTKKIKKRGGIVTSFLSYGSGLPAPEVAEQNPLRYLLTWNPRNVVRAGEDGAQYLEDGKIRILPFHQIFQRTWSVEVDGLGTFEAYPNRDSLIYPHLFGLKKLRTLIRGALRYPGGSETGQQIVKLGLQNESLNIPSVRNFSYREFTEMFLPLNLSGMNLEQRVANFLGISPTGNIMENLKWLGLFSENKIEANVKTPLDVMTHLLMEKLKFPKGARDMVILKHEIEAYYPKENNRREKITSTFVDYGEVNGFTAMSKTVGLPAAIAAKLLLTDELPITGCQIPTNSTIYTKVLKELDEAGLKFNETVTRLKGKEKTK
jgi:saccharopine dehydrogenase-like NADP-dependent oxidoreductase